MSQSAVLKQNQGFLSTLPLGVIIAWHRDLNPTVYIPTLPPGWVECDGKKIDDIESPFYGQDTPNLNGEGRFLRGAVASGVLQIDQTQTHTHPDAGHTHSDKGHGHQDQGHAHSQHLYGGFEDGGWEFPMHSKFKVPANFVGTETGYAFILPGNADIQSGYANIGASSDSRHGAETRPANMSIIWIMKVKQTVSARATAAVQAGENAPLGTIYVDQVGRVGIGTTSPKANLDVRGNIAWGNNGSRLNTDQGGSIELGGAASTGRVRTPYIDFHFKDDQDFNTRIINDDDGRLSLNASTFQITGNVGIGTKDPQSKLDVAGNIRLNGTLGTNGLSPSPRQAGWGGGIHTWDVEAEGTIWSGHGYTAGARDLAENYPSDMDLEPGDVVCMDPEKDCIVASEKPNDPLVLGVISTEPGFLLNAGPGLGETKVFPLALCGRVPCKVVAENGPIKRGDLLSSSSTPGHAMKSNPIKIDGAEFFRPGTIIGKALGTLESGQGVIDILVFSS